VQCQAGLFGRIGKTLTLLILLSFSTLLAEDVNPMDYELPPWLLLEKGKSFFRSKDFSTALNYFLYTQQEAAVFPEVEYWIGRIYEEEGEFLLAEEQYQKALQQKKYLYITDDEYEISYRLSRIYLNRQRWDDYETILLSIVNADLETDLSQIRQEHQYMTVLKEQGLDELFYLYRKDFRFSIRAFRELGIYYYKNSNYRSASIDLLYAVMGQVSASIQGILEVDPEFQYPRDLEQLIEWDPLYVAEDLEKYIQEEDPQFYFPRERGSQNIADQMTAISEGLDILAERGRSYPFSGVRYMLDKAAQRPQILLYLEEGLFYQNCYYLASSIYGEGFSQSAMDIWQWLASMPEAQEWQKASRDKLENPGVDVMDFLY